MSAEEIVEKGGPYEKICACGCGNRFNGRSNQKYLNTKHKARINNLVKANRRKVLEPIFKKMETNYRILSDKSEEGKCGERIPVSDLTRCGFDPNTPSTRIKDRKTGNEFFGLAKFAYRLSEGGSSILIIHLKDK